MQAQSAQTIASGASAHTKQRAADAAAAGQEQVLHPPTALLPIPPPLPIPFSLTFYIPCPCLGYTVSRAHAATQTVA